MPGTSPRLSGSARWVALPNNEDSKESSCPCLSRASTCSFAAEEHVDPRDKPGGDDNGESARGRRLFRAVVKTRTGQPWACPGHDKKAHPHEGGVSESLDLLGVGDVHDGALAVAPDVAAHADGRADQRQRVDLVRAEE